MPSRKPEPEEVQVHVYLERDLWRRVKVRAAQEETSAVEVVRLALKAYLSGRAK